MKLNFSEHIKNITNKISKTIGLLRKFQQIFPRSSFLTIRKTFIRSQLAYVDIIYQHIIKHIIPLFVVNLILSSVMHTWRYVYLT